MKTLLAIDTCTEVCSVSLLHNGVKNSRFIQGEAKSSSLILPLCDAVLREAGISVADLDGIIYTKGPGAFTGVRMCVSVVQGMMCAFDVPTLGVSTLEVLGFAAARALNHPTIAVALDARMGEVYWGVYQHSELTTERLTNPEAADKLGADFIGVGTGWAAFETALMARTGVAHFERDFYPKAEHLLDLYLSKKPAFERTLPLPIYLRNDVAQKSLK